MKEAPITTVTVPGGDWQAGQYIQMTGTSGLPIGFVVESALSTTTFSLRKTNWLDNVQWRLWALWQKVARFSFRVWDRLVWAWEEMK